eukprot:94479_1
MEIIFQIIGNGIGMITVVIVIQIWDDNSSYSYSNEARQCGEISYYDGNWENSDCDWIRRFICNSGPTEITEDKWSVIIDSPKIFQSEIKTSYDNLNEIDDTNSINWGINIFNESDWAIAELLLFNTQLSLTQIECVQGVFIKKYISASTENKTNANSDNYSKIVKKPE